MSDAYLPLAQDAGYRDDEAREYAEYLAWIDYVEGQERMAERAADEAESRNLEF